jgi:hypothetical protein
MHAITLASPLIHFPACPLSGPAGRSSHQGDSQACSADRYLVAVRPELAWASPEVSGGLIRPVKSAGCRFGGETVKAATALLGLSMLAALPQQAAAWGDDGHKTVALIAEHYLTPAAKKQVDAMLAADTDNLTAHDIASEATWADKHRTAHRETATWHFTDIEITDPDLKEACNGRQPLPAGTLASNGPAKDCVVDKIDHRRRACRPQNRCRRENGRA